MKILLLIDWSSLRPERFIGGQLLERTPALLSLLYIVGIAVLLAFLASTFVGQCRSLYKFETGLDGDVRKKLSLTKTNRSLRLWHMVFILLTVVVFGFHVYWTKFAEESNEDFQALSYKDLRQRRTNAASLRGWMLDRTGRLDRVLAHYSIDKDGYLARKYPLDSAMAHLIGTETGTPGLERTLFADRFDPMPEALEVLTSVKPTANEDRDVRLTIDRELQDFAAKELKGRKGAVVVLNPQNGEVLAVHSNPSFSLKEMSQAEMLALEANKRDNPLLNRAMREYYLPGSTFKTFTMIAAFRAGKQNEMFTSQAGGFVPFKGSKPITDANGSCEPPYGCVTLGISEAFEASSNQYFSQMAVALGRDNLKQTAKIFGMMAHDRPEEALEKLSFISDIWNASNEKIKRSLALSQSAIVTGEKISAYDLALQGMGQGYAGQITPFQMALIAAVAANLEGKLMKPKIELDRKPEMYAQVLSPQQAAEVRRIMALVTEGSGGTGRRVFARVIAAGIRSGGKTGTADKVAPLYDEKTGKRKTETRRRKNDKGEWEEYQFKRSYDRTDSWYISFAPLEKPTLAIAVVVEGGGYGASVAAPIAANIILKAKELGLLGDAYGSRRNAKPEAKK